MNDVETLEVIGCMVIALLIAAIPFYKTFLEDGSFTRDLASVIPFSTEWFWEEWFRDKRKSGEQQPGDQARPGTSQAPGLLEPSSGLAQPEGLPAPGGLPGSPDLPPQVQASGALLESAIQSWQADQAVPGYLPEPADQPATATRSPPADTPQPAQQGAAGMQPAVSGQAPGEPGPAGQLQPGPVTGLSAEEGPGVGGSLAEEGPGAGEVSPGGPEPEDEEGPAGEILDDAGEMVSEPPPEAGPEDLSPAPEEEPEPVAASQEEPEEEPEPAAVSQEEPDEDLEPVAVSQEGPEEEEEPAGEVRAGEEGPESEFTEEEPEPVALAREEEPDLVAVSREGPEEGETAGEVRPEAPESLPEEEAGEVLPAGSPVDEYPAGGREPSSAEGGPVPAMPLTGQPQPMAAVPAGGGLPPTAAAQSATEPDLPPTPEASATAAPPEGPVNQLNILRGLIGSLQLIGPLRMADGHRQEKRPDRAAVADEDAAEAGTAGQLRLRDLREFIGLLHMVAPAPNDRAAEIRAEAPVVPAGPALQATVEPLQPGPPQPARQITTETLLAEIRAGFNRIVIQTRSFRDQIQLLHDIKNAIDRSHPIEEKKAKKFNENSRTIDQLSEIYTVFYRDLYELMERENMTKTPELLHDLRQKEFERIQQIADLSKRIQPLLNENEDIVAPFMQYAK